MKDSFICFLVALAFLVFAFEYPTVSQLADRNSAPAVTAKPADAGKATSWSINTALAWIDQKLASG